MKRPTQDPEALLEALVRASRATPTVEQAERLERKLSPWLDSKPGIPLRPLYAATAVLAVVGLGLLAQPYAESGGSVAGRCSASRSAIFRRSIECTQSKCSATTRVLLLCSGPMKCHSRPRSASSATLATPSWT